MKNLVNNFDNVNGWDIHPIDVAETLFKMYINSASFKDDEDGNEDGKSAIQEQIEDAVYDLHTTCGNPYNRDSFRMLYQVLADITDNFEDNESKVDGLIPKLLPVLPNYYKEEDIKLLLLYSPIDIISCLLDRSDWNNETVNDIKNAFKGE